MQIFRICQIANFWNFQNYKFLEIPKLNFFEFAKLQLLDISELNFFESAKFKIFANSHICSLI